MNPKNAAAYAAWFVLAVMWLSAPVVYSLAPERLPIHFGWSGTPDGWAGPASIFLLPAVATFAFAILAFAQRYPNLGKAWLSDEQKARRAQMVVTVMPVLRLLMVLVFAYCQWSIVACGFGWASGMSPLVMIGLVGATLAFSFYHAWKSVAQG